MSTEIDINSTSVQLPQFDSDQTDTPEELRLEALLENEDEAAAEQFVDWLAAEDNRETLYHMIVNRLQDDDVKQAAQRWAEDES